ncbi:hypothetical protein [Fastidiosipila sanguinis]|uniref:Uncharacterized protein n=1 Tax=Fastidiosipila sanguinis TaxID=236753 RepID=A0A2S0KMG8_9FIRM|nr:hypothetical protein [Fastidiosipila sanguinis]AVM42207.1 hypothetical protein C5Q98_02700 [Fastidiosipila sanguinis]
MGSVYYLKCSNKSCQYQFSLAEGYSMMEFSKKMDLQEDILAGNIYAPEKIKELLKSGHHLSTYATFLCPICKEWKSRKLLYVIETAISPDEDKIFDIKGIHFLDPIPKCGRCKTELKLLLDPLSSDNCCPKCETGVMNIIGGMDYD